MTLSDTPAPEVVGLEPERLDQHLRNFFAEWVPMCAQIGSDEDGNYTHVPDEAQERLRKHLLRFIAEAGHTLIPTAELAALRDERDRARAALAGMLLEWDKFTRYGSPMAKAANERVAAARAALQAGEWK